MLIRQSRKAGHSLSIGSMTTQARWNFLSRNATVKNRFAGGHLLRIDRGVALRDLFGEIIGESLDLFVGELTADAPHVFEACGIGSMMAPEILQLRDHIG